MRAGAGVAGSHGAQLPAPGGLDDQPDREDCRDRETHGANPVPRASADQRNQQAKKH